MQIHGSAALAQSLLAAGLVDTLRLAIAPVVVGQGCTSSNRRGFRSTEPTGVTRRPRVRAGGTRATHKNAPETAFPQFRGHFPSGA
ncbi:dihydrofolate reductase family protein [Streptomyces sp. NPDC054786]